MADLSSVLTVVLVLAAFAVIVGLVVMGTSLSMLVNGVKLRGGGGGGGLDEAVGAAADATNVPDAVPDASAPLVSPDEVLSQMVVINLDRSPERLVRFRELMANADLHNINRFRAVEGRSSEHDGLIDALGLSRVKSSNGQIGCALSHYSLWCRAAFGHYAGLTVFEDDAYPRRDFKHALTAALAHVRRPFDMLMLGNQLGDTKADSPVVYAPTFCTHAYYVPKHGARRILKLLEQHHSREQFPAIDIFLIQMANRGFLRMCSVDGRALPPDDPAVLDAVLSDGPPMEARDTGIVFQNAFFDTVIGD